jgi:two-component system, NarL family, response regulator DesR
VTWPASVGGGKILFYYVVFRRSVAPDFFEADVALLDIEMPGLDGLAAAAVLVKEVPGCQAVIVTTFGRPGFLRRAMEAGATGFVTKDAPFDHLADAIRRVAAGERVVDPVLAAASLAHGASPLTARERDVLAVARSGTTGRT